MTIALTNVITFNYSSGNDASPIVLVTGVDDKYITGYNLNYHKEQGLTYRKYLRTAMSNVQNMTEEILEAAKAKTNPTQFKDFKKGQKFTVHFWPGKIFTKLSTICSNLKFPGGEFDSVDQFGDVYRFDGIIGLVKVS